jgi:HD-GYP domain-containing protein (c-di-GMP phosphodiesterase class II)
MELYFTENVDLGIEYPYEEITFNFFKALQVILFRHIEVTARHIFDAMYVGEAIADKLLELSEKEVADIKLALLLHDIGKIKTPIEILTKPGPLTLGE